MGTGYTRQSTYIDGDVIKADDTNLEFNHLLTVFALASGHTHDGSAEEGGYVPLISDSTATDKVEIVTGGAKTTGTHQVTGLVTADVGVTATTGNITATAGNIDATAGSMSAGTTVTSGTGITATTGGVTASAGDIVATTGDIDATAGSVSAGTTVTAGTTITAGTGLTVSSGNLAVSSGNITVSGTVDGRDVATDGTKLDGIESGAKDDQIASEVSYNNSSSALSATDVQAAIDEVEDRVDTAETNISNNDDRLFLSDVVDIAFGASPFSVTSTHDGNLIQCDTTGGNMVVNLPDSSSLSDDFRVTVAKMPNDANTVTVNRSGTDTINGNTSSVITTAFEAQNFVLDQSVGEWHAFGGAASTINASSTMVTASGNLTADDAQEALEDVFAGGLNLPSRNAVMNQDPVSQGTATRTGMSSTTYTGDGGTQAVATGVDGATGDLGALVWIKNRDQPDHHVLFDTVRGDGRRLSSSDTTAEVNTPGLAAITSTGVTVGNSGFVNTNTEDYVVWSFQTNQKTTGTTNRNKSYTAHYNADMGFSIVGYEGDGVAGHEIPHHLGAEPELTITKDRDAVSTWRVANAFRPGEVMNLNATTASAAAGTPYLGFSDTSTRLNTSSDGNTSGNNYISYHFRSVPGVSKVGKYIGTGAVGNFVDTGFKAGFVLLKNMSDTFDWYLFDNARGNGRLVASSNSAELTGDRVLFSDTGFYITSTAADYNTLNDEYLFLAFADSGSGPTTYSYPTSDDVLTIEEDSLISFAEGFNQHGQVDTQELVGASVTHTLGAGFENKHLWLYKDKGGSYATSEFRPLEGIDRDTADKWGVVSPSDTTLRTTAKHFDDESSTGTILASGSSGAGFEGYRAFDKDTNGLSTSKWRIASTTTSSLQYKQDERRILKSWRMRASDDADTIPRLFTVEGSDDGLNWTAIDSTYTASDFSDPGVGLWSDLQDTSGNTTAYLYHRINITANHGDATNTDIAELELNTILPSDYYLVEEGQMFTPSPELVSNGDFETDTTGWATSNTTAVATDSHMVLTNTGNSSGFVDYTATTEAGKSYTVTGEYIASSATDARMGVGTSAGGLQFGSQTFGQTSQSFTFTFTATTTTSFITLQTFQALSGQITEWDNISMKLTDDESVDRVYLAEIRTGGDGEVTFLRNLPIAKTKGTDAEYQGDVKVHGEIQNRAVATAWVNFDGTESPPLINESYNVADIVDQGTGLFRVVFEQPMDTKAYAVTITGDDLSDYDAGSSKNVTGFRTVTRTLGTSTAADSADVSVVVFGGKEIL